MALPSWTKKPTVVPMAAVVEEPPQDACKELLVPGEPRWGYREEWRYAEVDVDGHRVNVWQRVTLCTLPATVLYR